MIYEEFYGDIEIKRKRLVELLETPHKAELLREQGINIKYEKPEELIADFLLQNGVVALPCEEAEKALKERENK